MLRTTPAFPTSMWVTCWTPTETGSGKCWACKELSRTPNDLYGVTVTLPRAATLIVFFAFHSPSVSAASEKVHAATAYVGRITDVPAWHDLVTEPQNAGFVDAYIAVIAASRQFASFRDGAFVLEGEGQVGYNFGDQHHWEFNVAAMPRWRKFPWNHRIETTAAFGLGFSWATEVPEVEVALEGESHKWLVYWVMELTLGPPNSRWAASIRLHHRSPAFGLMGDDGGMNAPSVGVRYSF